MESQINKVRSRKKNSTFTINGINYGRVIAAQTYDNSFSSIIKEAIRLFLFDYKIEITDKTDSNIGLFYALKSSNRNDYDYIVNKFQDIVENVRRIDLIRYKSINKVFFKILKLIKNFNKLRKYNIQDIMISSIVITQYEILNEDIEKSKIFDDLELVCTFCDAHGCDNLITQIAKNKEIKTATLQHGQYRILSEGKEVADAEAYENFISDYMLTWGQATIDQFKKVGIEDSRFKKVGALKSFSFNNKIINKEKNNVFGVVLSGEYYRNTNIEMIKLANLIASKYNMSYYIRLHPRNNASFYEKYCNMEYLVDMVSNIENEDYANIVDFSILHMTGVFVELLSINSPIIIFKDELLENIFDIENYCISNIIDFGTVYDNFKNNYMIFLNEQYKLYRYFNEDGDVTSNYKLAIENIINN